jgi:hypothetical protein
MPTSKPQQTPSEFVQMIVSNAGKCTIQWDRWFTPEMRTAMRSCFYESVRQNRLFVPLPSLSSMVSEVRMKRVNHVH